MKEFVPPSAFVGQKHCVDLFYPRPALDGVEICVKDEIGFRVHKLTRDQVINLVKRLINLV